MSIYTDMSVVIIKQCIDQDVQSTLMELAKHTGIFMPTVCKIVAQWVAHLLNELQQWQYYKMCRINLEWFRCERGLLNQIIAVGGLLTRACELVLKWQSSTVTMETQGFTNSIIYEADDHFGMWHPWCSCVPSHYTASNCEYTVLQSFQQYPLCCEVR